MFAQRRKNKALIEAVAADDAEEAAKLLDDGAEPDYDCAAPFLTAMEKGHVEIGKLLLEKGLDPNERIRGGRTLLAQAVLEHKTEFVRMLAADERTRLTDGGHYYTGENRRLVYHAKPLELAESKGYIEISFLIAKNLATKLQIKADIMTAKAESYEKSVKDRLKSQKSVDETLPPGNKFRM